MRLVWLLLGCFRRDRADYLLLTQERRWMWQQRERSHYDTFALIFILTNIVWGTVVRAETPARAAAILRDGPGLSNRTFACLDCFGPTVASTGAPSVRDFPPPSPPRRLDGTLLSQPPTIYVFPRLRRR